MIRQFPAPPGLAPPGAVPPGVVPPGAVPPGGGGRAEAVPVRDAATVVLVRDGAGGVEVFCFRRVASMVFAAGMTVFPGGRTDPADADPAVPWEGPDPAALVPALGGDADVARALVVAAVRETFEECGVLLAAPPGGGPVTGLDRSSPQWEQARRALLDGGTGLPDLLRAHGLVLRADQLTPWARWITPPGERRRYDTRFFVVPMPPGQEALDLGGEGEHAGWVGADEQLRRYRAGQAAMLPPTVVTLEEVAAAAAVDGLRAAAREISPVMPWVEARPDGAAVVVDLDGRGGGRLGAP